MNLFCTPTMQIIRAQEFHFETNVSLMITILRASFTYHGQLSHATGTVIIVCKLPWGWSW